MGHRVSTYYGVQAFIWAFFCFISVSTYSTRYHSSPFLIIELLVFGIVVGAGFGVGTSIRRLRFLGTKGKAGIALSTILFVIGTMFIIFAIVFFLNLTVPLEVLAMLLVFVSSMPPASFASAFLMFLGWERRNKKLILSTMWGGTMYVYPKTESQQIQ